MVNGRRYLLNFFRAHGLGYYQDKCTLALSVLATPMESKLKHPIPDLQKSNVAYTNSHMPAALPHTLTKLLIMLTRDEHKIANRMADSTLHGQAR